MELEKVSAEIRPRSAWESVDLGCALVRRDFPRLMLQWILTIIPIQILIIVLLRNHLGWAILIIVFLKPIYDRVPLFFLSRTLFGERPGVKVLFRNLPKLLTNRFLWSLTLGRLSPSRSFTLPVSVLEGLRGRAYTRRARLLSRHGDGVAYQILGLCAILEKLLTITLGLTAYAMIPETMQPNLEALAKEVAAFDGAIPASYVITLMVFYLPAMMLIEIFYVGAGFGLYVNSRTLTEGWDIELAFKRLRDRLRGANSTAVLVAMICLFFSSSLNVSAQGAGQVALDRETIAEVLSGEEFEVKSEIVQVPVERDSSKASAFEKWLESLFGSSPSSSSGSGSGSGSGAGALAYLNEFVTMLMWMGLAALVLWLGYVIYKNRHVFGLGFSRVRKEEERSSTTTVVGLDVTPESLPDNLIDAARKALENGDSHLAMSLLYRGAISHFIQKDQVEIEEGDTEYDCVRRVKADTGGEQAHFFSRLTDSWVLLAYGKREPSDSEMEMLLSQWPFEKGVLV